VFRPGRQANGGRRSFPLHPESRFHCGRRTPRTRSTRIERRRAGLSSSVDVSKPTHYPDLSKVRAPNGGATIAPMTDPLALLASSIWPAPPPALLCRRSSHSESTAGAPATGSLLAEGLLSGQLGRGVNRAYIAGRRGTQLCSGAAVIVGRGAGHRRPSPLRPVACLTTT
jgi:hypothetical protein